MRGSRRIGAALAAVVVAVTGLTALGAAPAQAARRAFPAGWVNPAGTAAFEDWGFGSCGGSYLAGKAHLGADSQGYKTGSVRAVAAGTVRANVSWGGSWGRAVSVEHVTSAGARFVVVYGHVNSSLTAGTRVAAGQSVGTVFNQGSNSHVHLGVRPLGAGESGSSVSVKGMSGCSPVNRLGYVDPIPWLAARRPAGATTPPPPPPAASGTWATVRPWSAPWTVNTRTGPSTAYARNGSYADGARVLVVCQYRNGQTITDYYGPKGKTISWAVWNKTSTGQVFPDLYSDLPASPGIRSC